MNALPENPSPGLTDTHREGIKEEIQRLGNQMKRLRTLFELGEYDDDLEEYKRRRRELEVQVAVKEAELASSGPSSGELERRWQTLLNWEAAYEGADSAREKQRVWGSLVEEVRTRPRPSPSSSGTSGLPWRGSGRWSFRRFGHGGLEGT